MQLLAERQPWNLPIFMAVPVVLAGTVAITGLFLLPRRATRAPLVILNRAVSVADGPTSAGSR